ncbi:hypothetical protein HOY80DRAFT_1061752 [Tuber brumale]|nr:hypothetical protein HOY80DRAFT_1061752 [Tuber brumale]
MTVNGKLVSAGENLKPWFCCGWNRHQNKQCTNLEKTSSLKISNPMAVEVNGTRADISERMSRAISVQELPATPVPKRPDENADPALPALALDLHGPKCTKRRTLDFIEYNTPTNHRITHIIDYYRDNTVDDECLSREIELIRAVARKHPENQGLYAASRATYLVDGNGQPQPEMGETLDRVLGNQGGRDSLSFSAEITGQLIDALYPTGQEHDRPHLLPKIPVPSAQIPKRALSRKSTFRRSNLGPGGRSGGAGAMVSTRLSRFSIDYSDCIFDEYEKPSPTSEIVSTPGKRLDGWLLKQEEYFPPEKAAPVFTPPSLPGTPRTPTMRRARSAEFQHGAGSSVSIPLRSSRMRVDTTASAANRKERKKQKKAMKDKQAIDHDDNSSCVGDPVRCHAEERVHWSNPTPPSTLRSG